MTETALPCIGARAPSKSVTLQAANEGHRGAIRAFLNRLSPATIEARYVRPWTQLPTAVAEAETNRLLSRDPSRHVVLLATDDGQVVRGVGEFVASAAGEAEIALTVEDGYQHRGIGAILYRQLERLAQRRGLVGFTADVSYRNDRVRSMLVNSGRAVGTQFDSGLIRFNLRIVPPQD